MTAYYRNRETGLVQAHPVSGLGETFNGDEIGEDGKPIIPLGTSKEEHARLVKLTKELKATDASGDGDSEKGTK